MESGQYPLLKHPARMNTLADNTRLLQWQFKASTPAPLTGPAVFTYGSGREALLAWIQAQQNASDQSLCALLPAYLPEGIYAPFSRAGVHLIFYNIDQHGNPRWDELAQLTQQHNIYLAVLIHYFGGPRDSVRFRALLPFGALLLEDWAHTYPGYAPAGVGDWLLYSANKLAALPDGAWLIRQGQGSSPLPPHHRLSARRMAYLSLRWAYLLSATASKRWPWLNAGRWLKRCSNLAYLWSYRLLLHTSGQPGCFSRLGRWAWEHSPHEHIVQSRRQQAQAYAAGILSTSSLQVMGGLCPNTPAIGFPLWVVRRHELHQYLLARGVQGVYYTDRWWFAPETSASALASSRLFWECHYLLPINPALSTTDVSQIIDLVNEWARLSAD